MSEKVYTVYMSQVSGSVISLKNLQRLILFFDALKIKYTQIDISLEENKAAKENMITKSKSDKKTLTPQVFLDGEYIADFETIEQWNEWEELKQRLA